MLKAYSLARGHYLVMDPSVAPVLKVMSEMQRASPQERRAFIRNPRIRITEAVEADLRVRGELTDLSPEEQEEAIEAVAVPAFVETKEYSDRVIGVEVYRGNLIGREGPAEQRGCQKPSLRRSRRSLMICLSPNCAHCVKSGGRSYCRRKCRFSCQWHSSRDTSNACVPRCTARSAEEASGEVAQEGDGEAPKPGPIILKP